MNSEVLLWIIQRICILLPCGPERRVQPSVLAPALGYSDAFRKQMATPNELLTTCSMISP